MRAYYNEWDPFAAAWLRELIAEGHITPGDVDERSITEVQPSDLAGYDRVHFFAGIGGWDHALSLAGWPDDRPIWTGSCPCQPFSAAGKGHGAKDDRHLWPAFHRLIRECRPDTIAGEQVASAIGHGWLDLVCGDLEAEGYAVGAVVLGAHSVGAPHLRQRLWWVADAESAGRWPDAGAVRGGTAAGLRDTQGIDERWPLIEAGWPLDCGPTRGLGHADESGSQGRIERGDGARECATWAAGMAGGMALPDGGDASAAWLQRGGEYGQQPEDGRAGFWSDLTWLPCRDGKGRPTQPGIFPLAHGVSNRVGTLRGAGNAVVPQAAAAFLSAYLNGMTP